MPKVTFICPDGTRKTIDAKAGTSLLEIAHSNGLQNELEGACEGGLACSTCHVIVSPEWFNKLSEAEEAEEDMLDLAYDLQETSRLGCQIVMTEDLDGLEVTIPGASRNFSNKEAAAG